MKNFKSIPLWGISRRKDLPKGGRETIYLGADHAGFALKEKIKEWLEKQGWKIHDMGAYEYISTDDYPDHAAKVAKAVAKNKKAMGILFCGSGQGMCVAANKIKGIRAVNAFDKKQARRAREHLDANILCLSGELISFRQGRGIVETFFATPFSKGKRHIRRLGKIKKLERIT